MVITLYLSDIHLHVVYMIWFTGVGSWRGVGWTLWGLIAAIYPYKIDCSRRPQAFCELVYITTYCFCCDLPLKFDVHVHLCKPKRYSCTCSCWNPLLDLHVYQTDIKLDKGKNIKLDVGNKAWFHKQELNWSWAYTGKCSRLLVKSSVILVYGGMPREIIKRPRSMELPLNMRHTVEFCIVGRDGVTTK